MKHYTKPAAIRSVVESSLSRVMKHHWYYFLRGSCLQLCRLSAHRDNAQIGLTSRRGVHAYIFIRAVRAE